MKTKVLIGFYNTKKNPKKTNTEDKVSSKLLEKCDIKKKNKILSENNNAKKNQMRYKRNDCVYINDTIDD